MRSPTPLVSVIVPAFDAAGQIRETIESVLAQTFAAFELIVVDDGSRDATAAIVETFRQRDPRVRLVVQPNAGVGAARNTGIRHARGKYLAPLDADDLWSPRKLERQVARMEKAGPGAGFVYCWSHNIDGKNRVLSTWHAPRVEGWLGASMLLGNFISSASVPLFRASAVAAVGPYLTREEQGGGQGCEDWDLSVRIAERFRVLCVPEHLVSYRQAATSMSRHCESMAASYLTMMRRARARNPALPDALFTWSAARFYAYLAAKCYGWSDYSGALHYVGKVLSVDPAAWINPRNYRIATLSLLHLSSRGRWRRFPSPPPLAELATSAPRETRTAPAGSVWWCERIQRRRFEIALRTSLRQRSGGGARRVLAC